MPGSQTTPGPTGARNNAPADFAFRQVNNVGTRVANDFAAQWLAYTLPYRRFADVLADACARIGGDVDCYSFIAVDFHPILLASLPAHSLTLRPAHSPRSPIRGPLSEGFRHFVSSMPAPVASGWSDVAGWASHPLESAALARRTPIADPHDRPDERRGGVDSRPLPEPARTTRASDLQNAPGTHGEHRLGQACSRL